jgi:hypothetical protein
MATEAASKIKIFLWRALHGIIPLMSILVNRHIGTSGQCPVCQQAPEDIVHLLFQCGTPRDIWSSLGIVGVIDEAISIDRSGSAVLEFLLRAEGDAIPGFDSLGLKEVIDTTCWYLWWIHRRRTRDEPVTPIPRCKMSILSIMANAATIGSKPLDRLRWERPNVRQIKVNVDGSYNVNLHAGAVGAVIRDHNGKFIVAWTLYLLHVASAAATEAMAMREGLAIATQIGCNDACDHGI